MRTLAIAAAVVGTMSLAAGLASAQPAGGAPAPPPEPTTPEQPPVPPPPQPMVNPPGPPPTVPAPPVAPPEDDTRPNETVFGIGLGYVLPTSLETPNVTSVRVRFASGLILEPRVTLADSSSSSSTGVSGSMDTTSSQFELGVGALARQPMIKHGKFDFELVGSLAVDSTTNNPDGDNNNTTTTIFSLGWGIGIEYWLARHWQLSLTATNPLLAIQHESAEGNPSPSQTTTSFGIVFDPTVAMMVHVYN